MKKPITIKEIATLSGVSIATVSRVLNNNSWVSDKTRAKVTQVIEENNFSPNLIARGMVSKKTRTLAVVVSDITNPYFVMLVAQIESECLNIGYKITLFDTQSANKNKSAYTADIEESIFNTIIDSQIDGVIILGGNIDYIDIPEGYVQALQQLIETVPVVVVGRAVKHLNYTCVERDQTKSVTQITDYLIKRGHKRIGFIGGSPNVYVTKERVAEFKKKMASSGIPVNENLIVMSNFYLKNGYEAACAIIQNEAELPEALIAINDQVAMGAIRAFKDNNIAIPQDISIVSCEYFPGSEYYIPRITSVDHQMPLIGRAALDRMLHLLGASNLAPALNEIEPKLIAGESCA